MTQPRKIIDMGFTKEPFPEGTHMCLIYDNDAYRQKVISQFLAKGLAVGEQVGYFADVTTPTEVATWLKSLGVEVEKLLAEGTLEVFVAGEVYCPDGQFVPQSMLRRLSDRYTHAVQDGYVGARASGEMSWALRTFPGSDRLMEYEALINTISATSPVTPICQYDARRFDGATLLNVLKVHPLMIVESQIVRNPYYLPPQEFLARFQPAGTR